MKEYSYGGARALIALHEQHMRSYVETWRKAKKAGVRLPQTTDPAYKSMETLLRHPLNSSRGYITWICQKLELPDPGIDPVPELEHIEQAAEAFLEHVLERWDLPLRDVPEERFFDRTYKSNWDAEYCIEAMLEHAVMHPIRHEFQLISLMKSLEGKNK
jgi:uncharacterized damage-inducible protein DinB